MNFNSTLIAAAAAGLMAGVTGCGGEKPAVSPDAEAAAPAGDTASAGEKHACKGKNECKGRGGCKTEANSCKGQNECKGRGGCSGLGPSGSEVAPAK